MIRCRRLLLAFELLLCFDFLERLIKSITYYIIHYSSCKIIVFCFHNSNTEHYQYTSKAAVIKLSFWVRWHVMLLVCCRLQELELSECIDMNDIGLLEGLGSLHELTSLHLTGNFHFTDEAMTEFFHRPSMTSIKRLNLSGWSCLNDEGLEVIAERCNKLTYLHV